MNPNDVNVPTPDEMTPEVMVSLINQLSELNDCALSDPMGDDAGQAEVEIYLQGRGQRIGSQTQTSVHASIEYRLWFESFSDLLVHVMGDVAIRNLAHKNGWHTGSTVVESFFIFIPEPEDDGVTDDMVDAALRTRNHGCGLGGYGKSSIESERAAIAAAMAVQKNTP
jgi:hypothetical protein